MTDRGGGGRAVGEGSGPLTHRCQVRVWAHTKVMCIENAGFMHPTPGVVHNFPYVRGLQAANLGFFPTG